jgi:ATP/ADP translocase/HEAT repeat protein
LATFLRRILLPFVDLRDDESVTAVLMFAYAFLALTAYNIIQPLTRSKVIERLGAVNVPYVILAQGVLIGALMVGYTTAYTALPKRWALPIVQAVLASVMVVFWALFRLDQDWVSVAFYVWGALVGLLLTSQFWTLANGIYDPRQAKRVFGFIGGGIALGGMTGAALTAFFVEHVGPNSLLLVSAGSLVLCVPLVSVVLGRESAATVAAEQGARDEKGVTLSRAIHLLRESKQVQLVALVIAFGSLGAALLDQQVNMAAESLGKANNITKFLAQLRFGVSLAAFVIQVWVTPRIHRYLGVGFALLILPTNLGATAAAIILTKNIWAPAIASMGDRSLRYSVDKTTREVLFMPLPSELRQEVKPFVDVTVDRVARGVGGVVILLLVQPWGLHLTWYQLAWVSAMLTVAWYFMAIRAKNQYLQSFRQSIARHDVDVGMAERVNVADLGTIEALVEELASPDESRVVYAIDILESVGKRNLITPLLLHHGSPRVRTRALEAMEGAAPELGERWLPAIERALTDADYDVRTAAVRTLATLRRERAAELMRPYLEDKDPQLVITAAIALADSPDPADVEATEAALRALIDDARADAAATRREVAQAMPSIKSRRIHQLLLPLFYDPDTSVAVEAIRSAKAIGESDALFVPPLVALLRHRILKAAARDVLVGYGEPIVDVLGHFLRDTDEDPWVRRHIPATLARIPSQRSADLLAVALDDEDGFLRFKALSALEAVVRERPDLAIERSRLEAQTTRQAMLFFQYFSLRDSLRRGDPRADGMLLTRAIDEKIERSKDRIYRLLGLMYGWKDIAGARWALERGDVRSRASAAEFLDNLLKGDLRKRVMTVVEEMPYGERVRRANVMIRSRPRDVEDTVAQLVADEDQAVASAAIHYVEARRLDALESDLEHALAHRDVRDYGVFEAASWALASWRMPTEDRRAKWLEPLPAVEVASRLRRVPLFELVSVDELFRMAAIGKQVRYESGQRASDAAGRATIEFLLDGRVSAVAGDERGARTIEIAAPAVIGLEAILEEIPPPSAITAVEPTIALTISAEDFLTLLSNNPHLAEGLFRGEMQRAGAIKTVLAPIVPFNAQPRPTALLPVERALVLQNVPIFARAGSDELLALAGIAKEVPLAVGADLFAPGEPPAVHTIIAGQLTLQRNGGPPVIAKSGDTIGVVETLAGGVSDLRAQAAQAGSALRIDRDALFNLLSDRVDVLRDVFAAIREHPG